MRATLTSLRMKKVPTLYEADESKYVGPHRWQINPAARAIRRLWRHRAYTRWVQEACTEIDILGAEHLESLRGPAVFVANHQSHLDTLVVHAAVPERIRSRLYFGAAQDRWFVKGKKKTELQPWYQSLILGNFPILRGGGARALSYAHWLLRRGQNVFLFPEGTRATRDALGEFKHGATILARDNALPIVPVYLAGLREIRPKGSREVIPGKVTVQFLEPFDPREYPDVAAATQALHAKMSAVHLEQLAPIENQAA